MIGIRSATVRDEMASVPAVRQIEDVKARDVRGPAEIDDTDDIAIPYGASMPVERAQCLPHEARIRRLTRWVLEADRQAVRYRMRLPAMTIGPGRGSEHRHACLRALALLPDA